MRLSIAVSLYLLLGAAAPPAPPWISSTQADHPLVGRIWQSGDARFVTPEAMLRGLRSARYVLLGEKHDNADHHVLQAWLLSALIEAGRRPAVAFEMLTADQEAPLAAHLAARPGDAEGLGAALGWAESGWPDWSFYQPIAQAALDGAAPLLAAGLPAAELREVARHGTRRLVNDRVRNLGLDQPLSAVQQEALRLEIVEVHCNQLPEAMIGPMVVVTRVKDAVMAEALLRAAALPGRDSSLLIAGSGHARADRGVPWYLNRLSPGALVATLALVEVDSGVSDPAAYAELFGAETPPFDYLWFTPRVDLLDPCEVYAEQLEHAGARHKEQE